MENKNLDVLLITPARESNQYIVPPIGLGYLATALRKENFSVDILDSVKKNLTQKELINEIKKINPKVLGIQLFSYDVSPSKIFIKQVKNILPKIKIIIGGAHSTSEPLEVLNQFKDADYAFKGESEEGLPLLIYYLIKNKKINLDKIPGLIWRKNNEINVNNQLYSKDLDKYGTPAWDLIDPRTYKEAPQGGFLKEYPYAPISTSRGCPFRCSYCTVHIVSGRNIRVRSVHHVIEEIKMLKEKYDVKEIHILDDAFTASKQRVIEFCKIIIADKIKIKFSFPNGIRLDSLDEEVLLKMKEAGVQDFNVGVESGSDKILDDMKKSLTTKIIKEKTNLIKKIGLESNGFFIIGYPTETREDIIRTIKFAKQIPIKRAQFSLFKAYPGTDITNKLLEDKKIDKINYDSFMYYKIDYVPEGLTQKELKNLQRKAFLEFYLRPKILLSLLKEINSIEHFKFILQRTWYSFFVSK
jgi:radical SAM superfamily enzyme YgiQ (UPF0313 family)